MQLSELKWLDGVASEYAEFITPNGPHTIIRKAAAPKPGAIWRKYTFWDRAPLNGGSNVGNTDDLLVAQCILHHLCNPVK
jgi:hypothetical protein